MTKVKIKNIILCIVAVLFLTFLYPLSKFLCANAKKGVESELEHASNLQGHEAIAANRAIIHKYPENQSVAARALLQIGAIYYWQIKDFKNAEKEFEKLIKLYPQSKKEVIQAAYWVATINADNNLSKAIKYYKIALQDMDKADQFYIMANIGLASAYATIKDFKSAIETYYLIYRSQGVESWLQSGAKMDMNSFYEDFADLKDVDKIVVAYEVIRKKYPSDAKECFVALVKTANTYRNTIKLNRNKQKEIIKSMYYSDEDIAQMRQALYDIKSKISIALDLYDLDNKTYPTSQQGLQALIEKPIAEPLPNNWNGPYIKMKEFKDPWDNDYIYVYPGNHNIDGFDLHSKGKNGIGDGTDKDDINNWE